MNETWIKIYRKIIDHDVFKDEKAFRVFMWLLCSVSYETGELVVGRFWASSLLKMNPNTFYQVLKKLEKKYELVELNSNNKNTLVLLKNWKSYQQQNNNKITTKQQQNNNKITLIKNIRNKEDNNIYTNTSKFSTLESLTEIDFKEIAEAYKVPVSFVISELDSMKNWIEAKGKKNPYKNYKSALRNWVKRNAIKRIDDARKPNNFGKPSGGIIVE